jgi:hypothetical protein
LGEKLYKNGTVSKSAHPRAPPTARLTLVLLKLIKVGRLNTKRMFPPPINLTGYRSPEDLIEHGVRHIIV